MSIHSGSRAIQVSYIIAGVEYSLRNSIIVKRMSRNVSDCNVLKDELSLHTYHVAAFQAPMSEIGTVQG